MSSNFTMWDKHHLPSVCFFFFFNWALWYHYKVLNLFCKQYKFSVLISFQIRKNCVFILCWQHCVTSIGNVQKDFILRTKRSVCRCEHNLSSIMKMRHGYIREPFVKTIADLMRCSVQSIQKVPCFIFLLQEVLVKWSACISSM